MLSHPTEKLSKINVSFGEPVQKPNLEVNLSLSLNPTLAQQTRGSLQKSIPLVPSTSVVLELEPSAGIAPKDMETTLNVLFSSQMMQQGETQVSAKAFSDDKKVLVLVTSPELDSIYESMLSEVQLTNPSTHPTLQLSIASQTNYNGLLSRPQGFTQLDFLNSLQVSVNFSRSQTIDGLIFSVLEKLGIADHVALSIYKKLDHFSLDLKCASSDIVPQGLRLAVCGPAIHSQTKPKDPQLQALREQLQKHCQAHVFLGGIYGKATVNLIGANKLLDAMFYSQ